MTEPEQRDKFHHIIESYIAQIVELCPGSSIAAQVLVSWTNADGSTSKAFCGNGNHYARAGMADSFLSGDNPGDSVEDSEADDD